MVPVFGLTTMRVVDLLAQVRQHFPQAVIWDQGIDLGYQVTALVSLTDTEGRKSRVEIRGKRGLPVRATCGYRMAPIGAWSLATLRRC